ncbi:MAG: FumA C-terminus/TtdB family hydratase beta subunit [Actinobacteria bacterium]|nr:FumA C-terminus/TtdB family hydratase beta subunit [Actinomycetota bacterium]
MGMKSIIFPSNRKIIGQLSAGEEVAISGIIYTARDEAHRRLFNTYIDCRKFPNYLKESCIFYAGPAFYPDGSLSAIGPTTAARMDEYAPSFYEAGVLATIGKGPRDFSIVEACKKTVSVYLITYGGAASYLTRFVKSIELVDFDELGPEAIYRLEVEDFPAVVGIDSRGNYLDGAVTR